MIFNVFCVFLQPRQRGQSGQVLPRLPSIRGTQDMNSHDDLRKNKEFVQCKKFGSCFTYISIQMSSIFAACAEILEQSMGARN